MRAICATQSERFSLHGKSRVLPLAAQEKNSLNIQIDRNRVVLDTVGQLKRP
jgi:hypothetical protein